MSWYDYTTGKQIDAPTGQSSFIQWGGENALWSPTDYFKDPFTGYSFDSDLDIGEQPEGYSFDYGTEEQSFGGGGTITPEWWLDDPVWYGEGGERPSGGGGNVFSSGSGGSLSGGGSTATPSVKSGSSAFDTPSGGVLSQSTSGLTEWEREQIRLSEEALALREKELGKTSTTTTTKVAPGTPSPEMGEIPEYTAQEWDRARLAELAQEKASPGLRALRMKLKNIEGGYYKTPSIKAMTLREALAGYGAGLESVLSGAETAAESTYTRELAGKEKAGYANWQANLVKLEKEYEKAYSDYLQQYGTKTETTYSYGG